MRSVERKLAGRKEKNAIYLDLCIYTKSNILQLNNSIHTFLQDQRLGLLTSVVLLFVTGFSLQFVFLSKYSPLFPLYTGKKSKQMQKHHTKTYLLPCLQELSIFKHFEDSGALTLNLSVNGVP